MYTRIQKIARTLNVSSSAVVKTIKHMMKLNLMNTTQGKEDREFPLLKRIGSFKLPDSETTN